ncbi:DUF465 domain-containing protein [Candidatus Trichorickettsia mobilis]|uniref:DUF465 domain-containing protein n=1 Tax=Candidatus Trichorickettsia mobilis TaxID=1346319 RepID=A0ABZ0UVG0_9RICK|nr:YdcH family protein [Candidatus Trichorickettsia mobilis]WPY00607.1 DUF465 domain-containing protein [Candidatus Trichorickettsia mobilis]
MAMTDEELPLTEELNQLEQEHSNLNQLIDDCLNQGENDLDQLTTQRLKKRKLFIKDRIAYIKSILYPDIVA